jgi:hypothetical protein
VDKDIAVSSAKYKKQPQKGDFLLQSPMMKPQYYIVTVDYCTPIENRSYD